MGVKRRKLSIKRNKQDVSVQDQTVKNQLKEMHVNMKSGEKVNYTN